MCSMPRQFRPQVGAVEASEPQGPGGYGRIRTADHLKFEIGNDVCKWKRRVLEKTSIAEATKFLRAEEHEDDGAASSAAGGKNVCQREDGSSSGCVIIGAVVDAVAVDGWANAKMVEMRREQDDLAGQVRAWKDRDRIPGFPSRRVFEFREVLLNPWRQGSW